MPEIAEVTRIVHYLRTYTLNRRILSILTQPDDIIYGKVGTSAQEFESALTGRTIVGAKQQGKYFWLEMDRPPHPLMHFGMTGWLKLSNVETGYYKPEKAKEEKKRGGTKQTTFTDGVMKRMESTKGDGEQQQDTPAAVYNNAGSTHEGAQEWPPKYYKFVMKLEGKDGSPPIEAAFVDARRLGRIRLIDVPAPEMRNTTPLKENGPDPVVDKDILTVEWLTEKLQSKRNPIKAALIDQAVISGVGNWVADEILHDASVHPEQYCHTLTDAQCKQLHKSLMAVCDTACGLLGDSDQYPEDWIFKYRWSKGKKDATNVLPNGEKIDFVTAGGRTSAFVPSRQKKTGAVAADVDNESGQDDNAGAEEDVKPKAKGRAKRAPKQEDAGDAENLQSDGPDAKPSKSGRKARAPKEEANIDIKDDEKAPKASKKRKAAAPDEIKPKADKKAKATDAGENSGRRRSARQK